MEKVDNAGFDPAIAKYHLTLRYNPLQKPVLTKITPDDFGPKHESKQDAVIENLIVNSLCKNIQKSGKIALSLSGGVDSTLLLGLLRRHFPDSDIETISVRFADSLDETLDAARISEHLGASHNAVFVENYLEDLPQAISIVRQPFWDLHWYHVAKKAGSLSDILISGDGGDELFGGYTFRYEKFLSMINPKSTPMEKTVAYLQCHQRDHVPDQEKIFGEKTNFSWNAIHDLLRIFFTNDLSPLEQVFLADYNGKIMYNFSQIASSMSDFFKFKSFSPLLSDALIRYSMKIPSNKKYDIQNNLGKLPLRNLLEQLNLSFFVRKRKIGFSLDTANYWKSFGHKLCRDYLLESKIASDGWINQDWIDRHLNGQLDVRYINKFLGLLAFEIWYRLFITKEITSGTKLT